RLVPDRHAAVAAAGDAPPVAEADRARDLLDERAVEVEAGPAAVRALPAARGLQVLGGGLGGEARLLRHQRDRLLLAAPAATVAVTTSQPMDLGINVARPAAGRT